MPNPANQSTNREFPPSVHAYAGRSALCVSFSIDKNATPTVVVEFADKSKGRGFDWRNKIAFQLTHSELAELCAYMRKPWSSQKWVHRSSSGTVKGLVVTRQQGSLLFSISSMGRHINVPVIPRDQYLVHNLLMSRLLEVQPDLPLVEHQAALDRLAASHADK